MEIRNKLLIFAIRKEYIMAKFVYLDSIYYKKADESVQTVIINDSQVVYIHYKNGYYSYIVGLDNLLGFLNGNVNARFFCSDNTEDFENIGNLFE